MAARTRRGEIEIARPLLGIAKAELIAFCEARGVAFVRDPSNDDPAFARPRLRRLADTLAAEGLDAPALARLARRAALRRGGAGADDGASRGAAAASRRPAAATPTALAAEPPEIVRRG